MKLQRLLLVGLMSGVCGSTYAQQLDCNKSYGFRADVNGVSGKTLCASGIDSFLDAAKNFTLSNTGYTPTSSATALGRVNDVNMVLSYNSNSTTLNYRFVELNEAGSFTGTSRDLSEDQFGDYLEKSDILGRLVRYQAQHSPTSPITGVGGAIPTIGAADFATSFDSMSKISNSTQTDAGNNNLIGIGLSYGSYNVRGTDSIKSTTLPLSYTIRNDIDPRRQLVLSMPLTHINTGGAITAHGGLGAAYRLPLSDNWTLTPGVKYSVVASKDRATVATIMSASLMSTYSIPLGSSFHLGIGNMVGMYKTGKFSYGDYTYDPAIDLKMTRNGFLLSMPSSLVGSTMATEISLIDTRYLGDKPFVASTQEVGITMGTNKRGANARSFTRVGASYVRGKDTSGFTVNLGYWF